MDPTTLVTFLFKAPLEVGTVELLGSWDNFQLPYRMNHDRRRGDDCWSGCFKFENIIFDGDEVQWARPRSGGLKQGGTYWYFFRLNYDIDAYDDRQAHTTSCPLLPGQVVNVMEVPTEVAELPSRCHSAHGLGDILIGSLSNISGYQTLDPREKFAPIEPPPISKVHERCISHDDRLENSPSKVTAATVSPISTLRSRTPRSVSPCSRMSKKLHCHGASDSRSTYSRHSVRSGVSSMVSAVDEGSDPFVTSVTAPNFFATDHFMLPALAYSTEGRIAPLANSARIDTALASSSETMAPQRTRHEARLLPEENRPSVSSAGPHSTRDVQSYSSRPTTSFLEEEEQSPRRMYPMPTLETRDLSDDSFPASPASPISPISICSPRVSAELDENPTPGDGTFDTISQALSSYRLSAHFFSNQGDPVDSSEPMPAEATESERVRPLEPNPVTVLSIPRQANVMERNLSRLNPPSFLNYSLPRSAAESTISLAKTITNAPPRVASTQELPLPSIVMAEEDEGSMADAIFSELGYLRGNIN